LPKKVKKAKKAKKKLKKVKRKPKPKAARKQKPKPVETVVPSYAVPPPEALTGMQPPDITPPPTPLA